MKNVTAYRFKIDEPPESLKAIAERLRLARNVASMDWMMRQAGLPLHGKQNPDRCESTNIYHSIKEHDIGIDSQVASMLAASINSFVSGKLDWRENESGKAKRSDAIKAGNARPPYFTAIEIPVHNKISKLTLEDCYRLSIRPIVNEQPISLKIATSKLPRRLRLVLASILSGEQRMPCGTLHYRDKGSKPAWYWNISISSEVEPLDSDVEVEVWPTLDGDGERSVDRPFTCVLPGGRKWAVGDGRFFLSQVERLEGAIKSIGHAYRNRRTGAGHGRAKYDANKSRFRAQLANVTAEVRRKCIVDIIDQCKRNNAGTLVYREPTNPAKDKVWFKIKGVEWDWTRFGTDLKNSAARAGIKLKFKKLKIAEIQKIAEMVT